MQHVIERFGLLFSVKIIHPWFKEGICPYLLIEPDDITKRAFKRMHLIYRYYMGEIKVMGQLTHSDDAEKEVDNIEKHHFTFLLKLNDYSFFEVTRLDVTGFPREVYCFSNTAKGHKLAFSRCTLTDKEIIFPFEKTRMPRQVRILSQDGTEVHRLDVEKNAGIFKYNMAVNRNGLYTVVSTFSKADQKQSQTYYYDPLARKEPVLGVIDIETIFSITPEKEHKNTFTITFESTEK